MPSGEGEWFEKNPAENKDRIVLYAWKNRGMQMMVPIHFADEDTPQTFEQWEKETETASALYQRGEMAELADGFDVYYSYWYKGKKRIAYYSQRTVNQRKISCRYAGLSMTEVKQLRKACRSISPL